jgi:hypothetical protein
MTYIYEKHLKKRSGVSDNSSEVNSEAWGRINDGAPYKIADKTWQETVSYSSFQGFSIPGFHKRLRRGELLPHTPWKQIFIEGSATGEVDHILTTGDGGENTFCWWSEGNYPSTIDWVITEEQIAAHTPSTYDMYVQEAAAKIYSSGHDTLTFIAELADVRHLFLSTGRKLLKLKFPRNWRQMSNDWLSTRYGWRTLVYDIKDLHKALSKLERKKERTAERIRQKSSYEVNDYTVTPADYYYLGTHIQDKIELSIGGSVVADVDIPQFQFNPLQTGWEIIPFSFVVDWFVSVGKSIAALSFLCNTYSYAASCGYKITMERTLYQEIDSYKTGFLSGSRFVAGNCTYTIEERTPCHVPLTPHYKLRLNNFKIIDLLALITQRIRR